MEAFGKFCSIMLAFLLAICLMPILSAVLSGFGAWIVGLIWGDLILGFLAANLGITGYSMFQIGVIFGFLGGFVKAFLNTSKN